MTSIQQAGLKDTALLTNLGRQTFIESHGHSAAPADIDAYIKEKYTHDATRAALENINNHYYTLYHNGLPAGYSNIIFDVPHENISFQNVSKLDRLYVLKEFYDQRLGLTLLDHNIALSKQKGQAGMWLYVWKLNERAVQFYTKKGFKIIGSFDFSISANHSNPNHQMLLTY
jgi:GNAT superfamily N-acetyltransferase